METPGAEIRKSRKSQPGRNRETSVKHWWERDPKYRDSEGMVSDALGYQKV